MADQPVPANDLEHAASALDALADIIEQKNPNPGPERTFGSTVRHYADSVRKVVAEYPDKNDRPYMDDNKDMRGTMRAALNP